MTSGPVKLKYLLDLSIFYKIIILFVVHGGGHNDWAKTPRYRSWGFGGCNKPPPPIYFRIWACESEFVPNDYFESLEQRVLFRQSTHFLGVDVDVVVDVDVDVDVGVVVRCKI